MKYKVRNVFCVILHIFSYSIYGNITNELREEESYLCIRASERRAVCRLSTYFKMQI